MKEYSLICSFGNRKPFILDTFYSLDQAIAKIYEITNMDSEKNKIFYVDNDFFENKYPLSNRGRYLCLKQREVSKWEKYYSEEINSNKKNNIIEFKNYLL